MELSGTATSDQIALASSYTASGTTTVNVSTVAGFVGVGTYPLITGATGISAANFALSTVPTGYTFALSAAGSTLSLVVSGPAAPTGLVATGTDGQVALNWNASSGATSYTIRRSTTSGSGYSVTGGTTVETSFSDTTVTNGTTYYYVVTATNLGGASGNSNQASAQPLSAVQAWRFAHFLTIANTGNAADTADPDGDGMNNLAEFNAGTNPLSAADVLKAEIASATGGSGLTISFKAKANHSYVIEYKSDLSDPVWQALHTVPAAGADADIKYTDPASGLRRFYRVRTPAP
jgi:hypothetical protein